MEVAHAKIASIWKSKFTFDPEFKVFGRSEEDILLAGLYPWHRKEWDETVKHRPLYKSDPIGHLASSLARQQNADFATIHSTQLSDVSTALEDATYILFATHPLRELENKSEASIDPYLTYYAFKSDLSTPIRDRGASAEDVHELISVLENNARLNSLESLPESILNEAKEAGQTLSKWLSSSTKLGGLAKKSYFLPIPVALIKVLA